MTLVEQLGDDTLVGGTCSLLSFGIKKNQKISDV